jgi:hypothetical protein
MTRVARGGDTWIARADPGMQISHYSRVLGFVRQPTCRQWAGRRAEPVGVTNCNARACQSAALRIFIMRNLLNYRSLKCFVT